MVSLDDFTEVLFTERQIQDKVRELAQRITKAYAHQTLVVLTVMKGADNFSRDLRRGIMRYSLERYGAYVVDLIPDQIITRMFPHPDRPKEVPDQVLKIGPDIPYESNDVLIVEDIVDRGLTLRFVKEVVAQRNPRSVRICSLLSKPSKRRVDLPVDYLGFEVEDKFVVGYGLDFNERYRDIPFIGVLKPEIYAQSR